MTMTHTQIEEIDSVTSMRAYRHDSPLGEMRSLWTPQGLYSLSWISETNGGAASSITESTAAENTAARELDRQLERYFAGEPVSFDSLQVDHQGRTEFTRRVYQCCRQISFGQTSTYKELATRSGNEAASRAVGAAMSRNRVLLIIPCHRVISQHGQLRGFSAPGGLTTKQFLLDLETK